MGPVAQPPGTRRRRVVWAALAISLVALGLSIGSVRWLRGSLVDVGIDADPDLPAAPVLSWEGGRAPMERIATAYSPKEIAFTLVATGRKNPASVSSEVWLLDFPAKDGLEQEPPGSWFERAGHVISVPERHQPAKLHFKGVISGAGSVQLLSHSWSGEAVLVTGGVDEVIDLYSLADRRVTLPVQGEPLSRFHAVVPRSALGKLQLEWPRGAALRVRRLYVGALEPVRFSTEPSLPSEAWGKTITSWQPDVQGGVVRLPSISAVEQGGAASFFALWAVFVLLGSLVTVSMWSLVAGVRWLISSAPKVLGELAPWRPVPYLLLFLPLLGAWLVSLAAFFPAVMSSDSLDQWRQSHSLVLNDAHPVLHTLITRVPTLIWDSPAAVVLLQAVTMAAVLAFGYQLLLRAGAPLPLVVFAWLTDLLSPRNAQLAVVLWKDTLYSCLLYAVTAVAALLLLSPRARVRRGLWVALGVMIGALPLFRHNGLVVLAAMPVALVLGFWTERRRALIASGTAVAVFLAFKVIIYPALHVIPLRQLDHWMYTQRIAALVADDVPLAESEYEFLGQVRSFDDRWAYNPVTVDPTIFSPLFHSEFGEHHLAEYSGEQRSLFSRYPLLFVRQHLRLASIVYWPPEPMPRGYALTAIQENDLGLASKTRWPAAQRMLTTWLTETSKPALSWLFWRPAVHLYLVLAAAALLLWRLREPRMLIVYVPALANSVGLFLVSFAQEHRYHFPLTLAAGLLVCLAMIRKR